MTTAALARRCVCGVDEAGRGPLAGPVVVAGVVLVSGCRLPGLDDSKRLSARQREALAILIRQRALFFHVVSVSVETIERLNILGATLAGMREVLIALRAVEAPLADVRIDGNQLPADLPVRAQTVTGGDRKVRAISAASILAKVERDAQANHWEAQWPGYGFAAHKGYSTPQHLEALARLGPTPLHRRGFAPVAACLQRDLLEVLRPVEAGV